MNFITALRQHSAQPYISARLEVLPCPGIGVPVWDFALVGTFRALCLKESDRARLHHLDEVAINYERRVGVVAEADPTNESAIAEIERCARLLRRWQADLRDDSILRRAA